MRIKLTSGLIVIGSDGVKYEAEATEYPARKLPCDRHEIAFLCCGELVTAIVSSEFVQEVAA